MVLRLGLVAVLFVATACTRRINVCDSDEDCTDPAYPFCDTAGEYAESGNRPNTCSIVPSNCSLERCGCTPGVARCAVDAVENCEPDESWFYGGSFRIAEACPLGCEPTDTRCLTFEPSYGLGPQLVASANEASVSLPDGAVIDTTDGTVREGNGTPISVRSVLITQPGGPAIRVFLAKDWAMRSLTIRGAHSFAAISTGPITIEGYVDASANGTVAGPGARSAPADCAGKSGTAGGGGGGNATKGGYGNYPVFGSPAPGGAAGSTESMLAGGCRAGDALDTEGGVVGQGGAGGGAIQLVSMAQIELRPSGILDVGGGGAAGNGGGGSGGTLVLEAPIVHVWGTLVANGGSGGACNMQGTDGGVTTEPAPAPGGSCSKPTFGGTGGSIAAGPGSGGGQAAAGGGGAMGWLRIATRTGAYEGNPTVISAAVTTSAIDPL